MAMKEKEELESIVCWMKDLAFKMRCSVLSDAEKSYILKSLLDLVLEERRKHMRTLQLIGIIVTGFLGTALMLWLVTGGPR